MPMKAAPPCTPTAQNPYPSRSSSVPKRSIMASLSSRVGADPREATTSGWAFNS